MNMNLVYVVLLAVFVCHIEAKLLQKEHIPGEKARVQLVAITNETESLEFELFPNGQASTGLILPVTTFYTNSKSQHSHSKPIQITSRMPVIIKCSKGSFLPVYIKDEGRCSGEVPQGFEGPFCLSIWTQYPHVSQGSKVKVPYAVKKGKVGNVGLTISMKGEYGFVAQEDILFL